ncbi:MAG TPA: class I SAM-dependent methyltransferase [Smithellaceae bacterium]|nr:class I SAM-dependent methyltransferase [Smithellaceae bacterium]
MTGRTFHQLYAEHKGKVSDKWSLYLTEYDRLLDPYREEPVNLLEIGIQNGGSLEIWSKYFKNYQTLIGCDINPDCANLCYEDPRISVVVGDAGAPETRDRIAGRVPLFDIIIDDGSHRSGDIIRVFSLYFPLLAAGGTFIVEDIHCSYWEGFQGGLFYPYSAITFFKRLADIINYEHWNISRARNDILQGIFTKYDCYVDEETLSGVHSVEFINSMCVIRKAKVDDNRLGSRMIVGDAEPVTPGVKAKIGKPDPVYDQSLNPWTVRSIPPDEMIQQTEQALAHMQIELTSTKKQIAQITSSYSWKMTRPLREAGRWFAKRINDIKK